MSEQTAALVIGASSGIAGAIIDRLEQASQVERVVAVSRRVPAPTPSARKRTQWLDCDYTEESIDSVISQIQAQALRVQYVFICNGILHGEQL